MPNFEKKNERLEILKRIEKLESEGIFDKDVENDPETIPLKPGEVDFLRESTVARTKANYANRQALMFFNAILRDGKVIIKDIKGSENFKLLNNTGYIITCNHFNPYDTFVVEKTFRDNRRSIRQKLYKVIREGNYTNFPGFYGFLMRNCYTLPLSENKHVLAEFLAATKKILQKRDAILVFPEESMWWNYRKPKPLKSGAFNIAVRENVPILPIFITMEDTDKYGEDGFPIQAYTVNISKPIYPDKKLGKKDNINNMKDKNYEVWKEIYENFYNTKLVYNIKKD